jgi:hypothetical protein
MSASWNSLVEWFRSLQVLRGALWERSYVKVRLTRGRQSKYQRCKLGATQ